MSLGKRKRHRKAELWISTSDLLGVGGHPFYSKLEEVMSGSGFDDECEKLASPYYSKLGQPGLPPGIYARMLLGFYLRASYQDRFIEISEHDPSFAVARAEVVEDKGYHSGRHLVALEDSGYVSYVSESDHGRRRWKKRKNEQGATYRNRRRIQISRIAETELVSSLPFGGSPESSMRTKKDLKLRKQWLAEIDYRRRGAKTRID